MEKILITKREASEYTGFSRQTIKNWIDEGILNTHLIHGVEYVDKNTLSLLLDSEKEMEETRRKIEAKKKALDHKLGALEYQLQEIRGIDEINEIRKCRKSLIHINLEFYRDTKVISDLEYEILCMVLDGKDLETVQNKYCYFSKTRLIKFITKSLTRIQKTPLKEKYEERIKELENKIQELKTPKNKKEWSDKKLCDLSISVRLYHCLTKEKIYTVKEFMEKYEDNPEKLKEIRNIGKRSVEEAIELIRMLQSKRIEGI